MAKRYAVALYVPFIVRVSGISADSPEAAVALAQATIGGGDALPHMPEMRSWESASEPTLAYVHPHEPCDAIGALVDEIDPETGDYENDGEYRAMPALHEYSSETPWQDAGADTSGDGL